jgi:hypothetical protein
MSESLNSRNWKLIEAANLNQAKDAADAELIKNLRAALEETNSELHKHHDSDKASVWNEAYALGRSRKLVENPYQDQNLYGQ